MKRNVTEGIKAKLMELCYKRLHYKRKIVTQENLRQNWRFTKGEENDFEKKMQGGKV